MDIRCHHQSLLVKSSSCHSGLAVISSNYLCLVSTNNYICLYNFESLSLLLLNNPISYTTCNSWLQPMEDSHQVSKRGIPLPVHFLLTYWISRGNLLDHPRRSREWVPWSHIRPFKNGLSLRPLTLVQHSAKGSPRDSPDWKHFKASKSHLSSIKVTYQNFKSCVTGEYSNAIEYTTSAVHPSPSSSTPPYFFAILTGMHFTIWGYMLYFLPEQGKYFSVWTILSPAPGYWSGGRKGRTTSWGTHVPLLRHLSRVTSLQVLQVQAVQGSEESMAQDFLAYSSNVRKWVLKELRLHLLKAQI